jgi:hypothetical protein
MAYPTKIDLRHSAAAVWGAPCVLRCPSCGYDYLHQGKIEIFNRPHEDGPSVAVTVESCAIPRLGATGRNPSSRRQGMLIYFECEGCDGPFAPLGIWQHKGQTFIEWISW